MTVGHGALPAHGFAVRRWVIAEFALVQQVLVRPYERYLRTGSGEMR